jgi:hypothetical protein
MFKICTPCLQPVLPYADHRGVFKRSMGDCRPESTCQPSRPNTLLPVRVSPELFFSLVFDGFEYRAFPECLIDSLIFRLFQLQLRKREGDLAIVVSSMTAR